MRKTVNFISVNPKIEGGLKGILSMDKRTFGKENDCSIEPFLGLCIDEGEPLDFYFIQDGETLENVGLISVMPHHTVANDFNDPCPEEDGSLYCYSLGIIPGKRRIGYIQAVMEKAIPFAKELGYKKLVVNTRSSNSTVIKICDSANMKFSREIPEYYYDPREATAVLEVVL